MKNQKTKRDIIFVGIVLLIVSFMWVLIYCGNPMGDTVIVLQNGEEIGRYSLTEDTTVVIAYGEEYNLLIISDGKAFISDADCPDGLCIRQRAVSKNDESIICLPHKLVIQVEAKEEGELDAVTY